VLDVSKNKALKILEISYNPLASLDLSNNIALEEVDVSKNELASLILPKSLTNIDSDVSNAKVKPSDEPKEYTLKELDVSNNRFTLSQLYKFMSLNLTELTIGNQYFVELPALAGSAIVAGKAYDISTEIAFNGVPTDFTFFYNGKEADPLNDYTLKDGKLTFLKSGYYLIEMTNKEVYDISEHGPPSRESLVSTGVLTVERREEEVR
jgi:hypothetical protein